MTEPTPSSTSAAPPVSVGVPHFPRFHLCVAKQTFKFNAAHFVTFKGFRERLHGHNYSVATRLLASSRIGPDGYVIDFGDIKKIVKDVCKELNEYMLIPSLSDVMDVGVEVNDNGDEQVTLLCEDGARFVFPRTDCVMLPIVHSTAEELAVYVSGQILNKADLQFFRERQIHTLEVTVSEAPGQDAVFSLPIPTEVELKSGAPFDVKSYILGAEIPVTPCPSIDKPAARVAKPCTDCVDCEAKLSAQLQKLSDSINRWNIRIEPPTTKQTLQKILDGDVGQSKDNP